MIASQKNKLGRVDLYVTAMSFGGVAIGNLFRPICELESDAMIQRAWDAGVRYYDTAPMYGHGLSELRIGHSLRRKNRDDFVLSSKVGRILKPTFALSTTSTASPGVTCSRRFFGRRWTGFAHYVSARQVRSQL